MMFKRTLSTLACLIAISSGAFAQELTIPGLIALDDDFNELANALVRFGE